MRRLFRYSWFLLTLLLIFGGRGLGALRLEASAGGWDAAHERNTRFSLANARGDVTTQVDVAGNVTWQASYEAFGARTREEIGGVVWDLAASKVKIVSKIQSIVDKAATVREVGTAVAQGDTKALLEMGSGAALGMAVKKGASKVQNTTASVSKPNGAASTAAKTTGWGEQAGSPHVANVTVRGPDGKIVHQGRTTSGSMTPTEKEFGFPQGQNSSHTEAKTVMDPSIPSGPGNTMCATTTILAH